MGVEANVLDKPSLEKAKNEINEKLGKIDLLINGAGGNSPKATTQIEKIENQMNLKNHFMDWKWKGLSMFSI